MESSAPKTGGGGGGGGDGDGDDEGIPSLTDAELARFKVSRETSDNAADTTDASSERTTAAVDVKQEGYEDENEDENEDEDEKEDEKAEIDELMDTLIDRVECRWQVVDDGDAKAFPQEGMCWVALRVVSPPEYKGEDEIIRLVMWPAWLIAPNKVYDLTKEDGDGVEEEEEDDDDDDDDDDANDDGDVEQRAQLRALRRIAKDTRNGLRTVCCYGDGRFIKVKLSAMQPFESRSRQGTSRGGQLWNAAVKQAQAQTTMASEAVQPVAAELGDEQEGRMGCGRLDPRIENS